MNIKLLICADNDNITGGPLENYPLYSQDDKGKETVCHAIFAFAFVRWFI